MPKIPGIWPKMPKSHTALAGENDQNYHPVLSEYSISPVQVQARAYKEQYRTWKGDSEGGGQLMFIQPLVL